MRNLTVATLVGAAVCGMVVSFPAATNATAAATASAKATSAGAIPVPTASRFATSSKQVIVVSADRDRTSHAKLKAFERRGDKWQKVLSAKARIGANGLVLGTKRRQGSMTTPAGIYYLTQSFGRQANPGTAMPFTRIGPDNYWVGDNASPFYNQGRLGSQGGFKKNLSERMDSYNPEYNYGVVIDFNRPNPVRGRGFAIFLHVNGPGATAGCVSVGAGKMKRLLRWLEPAQQPVIAIGRQSWLNS